MNYLVKAYTFLCVGLSVLGLLFATSAIPAHATHVDPIFVPGNPTCSALAPAGTAWIELKVEPVASGTYTDGILSVTIVVNDTPNGPVFDWSSNIGIDAVFVKGGPNGNLYQYDPPAEATADTGLHAPVNASNGKYFGLSHISFCYDVAPSIAVTKGGHALSKVGDTVTYEFTITNDGDIPLQLDSVSDTVLGDLTAAATAAGCDTLGVGDSCAFSVDYTIPDGSPDPLENTVTVNYSGTLPGGATAYASDSDGHSVNLFQPAIEVTKTGDELSKVGDDVDYTITLSNNSSTDTPALQCTAVDSLLGTVFDDVLPLGNTELNLSRTVQAGDPDPLVNTVTLSCSPQGFPNVLEASDSHSTNLFQPAVEIVKTGDELSKATDEVTYHVTIFNRSSSDSPNLLLDSFDDSLVAGVTPPAACDSLTPDDGDDTGGTDQCSFSYTYTVQDDDPDPLLNTATVHYHPDGFPNDISDSDDHAVNLFQPSISFVKSGDELSKVGDEVHYTLSLQNTSSDDSPDLACTISDAAIGINENVTLAAGEQHVLNPSYTVQVGNPDPFVNTASVNCQVDGFSNVLTASDSHTTNLFQPAVQVEKSGPTTAQVGDTITYDFEITNSGSTDSPDLVLDSVSDTVLGNLTAVASAAGCDTLAVGASCSFSVDYTIEAGDPNPLVNVVTVHYHPDGFPNDVADEDDHAVEIVAAAQGCTPGYWKNHLSAWVGYLPTQTVEDVFNVPNEYGLDNDTLLQALNYGGGSGAKGAAQILLRAAVAALLNAAHPDVTYPRTEAAIIADVNAALASKNRSQMLALATALDADNNLGCPLNGGNPKGVGGLSELQVIYLPLIR